MILTSAIVAFQGKSVVDVYDARSPGRSIKFAEKLGRYGTLGAAGHFVLIVRSAQRNSGG
jgi:hypothetical protein